MKSPWCRSSCKWNAWSGFWWGMAKWLLALRKRAQQQARTYFTFRLSIFNLLPNLDPIKMSVSSWGEPPCRTEENVDLFLVYLIHPVYLIHLVCLIPFLYLIHTPCVSIWYIDVIRVYVYIYIYCQSSIHMFPTTIFPDCLVNFTTVPMCMWCGSSGWDVAGLLRAMKTSVATWTEGQRGSLRDFSVDLGWSPFTIQ